MPSGGEEILGHDVKGQGQIGGFGDAILRGAGFYSSTDASAPYCSSTSNYRATMDGAPIVPDLLVAGCELEGANRVRGHFIFVEAAASHSPCTTVGEIHFVVVVVVVPTPCAETPEGG